MVTLHAYILRELLKTLALTVTALTGLLTMGGGLLNVIRAEGVAAGDIAKFIPLLAPIFLTITLPVAALFSATLVYGRLAADNEFTACRAAGINVHRLFVPAFLLAFFVALFTLLFGNLVIPRYARQLTEFARYNVRDLVARHLQREGFAQYQDKKGEFRYTITAERVQNVSDEWLRAGQYDVDPGLQYLLITNPTLLHIGRGGKLERFTVARYGLCMFDTRAAERRAPLPLTLFVFEARNFDVARSAAYIGAQQIGPYNLPLSLPFQLSASDLRDLIRWRRTPWEVPRLADQLREFRLELAAQQFYTYCAARLDRHEPLLLRDDRGREYRLTADTLRGDERGLLLSRARIEVFTAGQPQPTRYEAEQVTLRAKPLPSGSLLVDLTLVRTPRQDVLQFEPRGGRYDEPLRKPTLNLDGTQVPDEVLTQLARITDADVIDPARPLNEGPRLADKRIGLQKSADQWRRKVESTLHFRLGYTASAMVTVLMGAALGVIFRGSRALAAFALAMIPFFGVMILLVLGQRLAEDARTNAIAPVVTWGSLLATLAIDALMVRLGVRR